jgi:hypothetical protein
MQVTGVMDDENGEPRWIVGHSLEQQHEVTGTSTGTTSEGDTLDGDGSKEVSKDAATGKFKGDLWIPLNGNEGIVDKLFQPGWRKEFRSSQVQAKTEVPSEADFNAAWAKAKKGDVIMGPDGNKYRK